MQWKWRKYIFDLALYGYFQGQWLRHLGTVGDKEVGIKIFTSSKPPDSRGWAKSAKITWFQGRGGLDVGEGGGEARGGVHHPSSRTWTPDRYRLSCCKAPTYLWISLCVWSHSSSSFPGPTALDLLCVAPFQADGSKLSSYSVWRLMLVSMFTFKPGDCWGTWQKAVLSDLIIHVVILSANIMSSSIINVNQRLACQLMCWWCWFTAIVS